MMYYRNFNVALGFVTLLITASPYSYNKQPSKTNDAPASKVTLPSKKTNHPLVAIPDTNFRIALQKIIPNAFEGNMLISNHTDVLKLKTMDVEHKNIYSIEGVQYFTALEKLYCNNNQISTLDISKNTALKLLTCFFNKLHQLDISNNPNLEVLQCNTNQLSQLDVSHNTALTRLICYNNQIRSINLANNTALNYFYIDYNKLKSIDLSKNKALDYLSVSNNQLTKINVSNNTMVTRLLCDGNQISKLDLSKNTALKVLNCSSNQLKTLDLSKNTFLVVLHCVDNQISNLDARGIRTDPNNYVFDFINNPLTKLAVHTDIQDKNELKTAKKANPALIISVYRTSKSNSNDYTPVCNDYNPNLPNNQCVSP